MAAEHDFLPSTVSSVVCADWSAKPDRRAAYLADVPSRTVRQVRRAELTLATLLDEARSLAATGQVLVGFDLPLGVPTPYLAVVRRRVGWNSVRGFVDWLPRACTEEGFFNPTDGASWSVSRPFFAVPAGTGGRRGIEARIAAAGAASRRRVDQRTRANPIFATSGIPGSVGSAVRDVWSSLGPLLSSTRDFAVWPMEGTLARSFSSKDIVLGEIYPRAAYATALTDGPQAGAALSMSQRRRRPCARPPSPISFISDG